MSNELRELLMRIVGDSYQDSLRAVGELRALLAQPAEQHHGHSVVARVCAYTPGLGQVELQLPGNLPSWLELGETVTVRHGNAQHQGEMVHMVRTHGSCCWEEVGSGSLEDFQSMPEEYELRALYTRPGALAAVVLPERKPEPSVLTEIDDDRDAAIWNACLDEVARLNPPQQ
ncbi:MULTISPECIES: hypothetical protein [unclassified Pseudomonas]|uniref:hypothetical protein n=1 Tax=unclassified Pseudomonas TaxID=196821 RepID=UPI000A1F99BA|nr:MULTISPECIES: hypothetical protein [unclassified Pseudomonas]